MVKVLSAMELTGVKLDQEQLNQMGEIGSGIHRLTEKSMAWQEKSLTSILPNSWGDPFEKLGLPPLRKPKQAFQRMRLCWKNLLPNMKSWPKFWNSGSG